MNPARNSSSSKIPERAHAISNGVKKVLIFSLAYFPKHVGGAEVAIKEKTDRMPDVEFHMVTNRYDSTLPKIERVGNVLVHRIGFARPNPSMGDLRRFPLHFNKLLFQFLAAWKALMLHRKYRYDCTWAMMAHSCGVPAAIFKIFNPTVPFVLELQEGDPPEYIERTMLPLWPLFSRAFKRADALSVISTFLGRWGVRRGFRGKPALVPNAVDTAHFSREYPERAVHEVMDALGKRMGDVFLITTSRLVHKNAVDDCIRALAFLPEHIRFIVLGTGPDEAALRGLADSLKVAHRVSFVGQVGHETMPLYLKASDIFIRPSRSEGMGNSFVEAMAAGLPVIATQEGGIADFLFDETRNPEAPVTGFAVDKDSPEQIAAQVKHIMEHPEKVRAVVHTARAMVLEKYDWDTVARTMREEVFAPLLGRG
jgi:glycosyltransferase involved in cell wall biosynthesis